MDEKELKKLILHKGKIDEEVFLSSFSLKNAFLRDVFRVLQEIDCTVHKYHFPMEIDFLIHQN